MPTRAEGRTTNTQAVAPTSPKGGEGNAYYVPHRKVHGDHRHQRNASQKEQPPLGQVTTALAM